MDVTTLKERADLCCSLVQSSLANSVGTVLHGMQRDQTQKTLV